MQKQNCIIKEDILILIDISELNFISIEIWTINEIKIDDGE